VRLHLRRPASHSQPASPPLWHRTIPHLPRVDQLVDLDHGVGLDEGHEHGVAVVVNGLRAGGGAPREVVGLHGWASGSS